MCFALCKSSMSLPHTALTRCNALISGLYIQVWLCWRKSANDAPHARQLASLVSHRGESCSVLDPCFSCAGLAVLADMLLTTHFMMLVMLTIWRLPLIAVVAFYFFFAPIEATYWSSTLEKIPTGAQPITITVTLSITILLIVNCSAEVWSCAGASLLACL